jgi:hypothetical protein
VPKLALKSQYVESHESSQSDIDQSMVHIQREQQGKEYLAEVKLFIRSSLH